MHFQCAEDFPTLEKDFRAFANVINFFGKCYSNVRRTFANWKKTFALLLSRFLSGTVSGITICKLKKAGCAAFHRWFFRKEIINFYG
jgi:hypothetical protein